MLRVVKGTEIRGFDEEQTNNKNIVKCENVQCCT